MNKRIYIIVAAVMALLAGAQMAGATFNPEGGGTYLLQSSISSGQVTITLTSFTEPGSNIPLTMSYINSAIEYGTINPSSGNSEFISFTGVTQNVNGTALLTGVTRGLARTPGTGGCVASTTLAHAYPGQTQFILSNSPCYYSQYAVKQNDETISGQWTFTTFPITPASPAASETTAGISELSTGAEAAAGTSSGGTGFRLVLPGSLATSTFNSATAANRVLITDSLGHINAGFVSSSTQFSVSATTTLSATSSVSIGAFPAWQIGKQRQVFASTGTTTFAVPSGITKVHVMVQGAGGAGGGSGDNTAGAGSGGGGGGYSDEIVDVTGTSTIQVFVGTGGTGASSADGTAGTWSTFGTNGFYLSAAGGGFGGVNANSSGGTGGCGANGDINSCGGSGGNNGTGIAVGGVGGGSRMGAGGGQGQGSSNGLAGAIYGGGGAGAATNSATDRNGGAGAQGIVVVEW